MTASHVCDQTPTEFTYLQMTVFLILAHHSCKVLDILPSLMDLLSNLSFILIVLFFFYSTELFLFSKEWKFLLSSISSFIYYLNYKKENFERLCIIVISFYSSSTLSSIDYRKNYPFSFAGYGMKSCFVSRGCGRDRVGSKVFSLGSSLLGSYIAY